MLVVICGFEYFNKYINCHRQTNTSSLANKKSPKARENFNKVKFLK